MEPSCEICLFRQNCLPFEDRNECGNFKPDNENSHMKTLYFGCWGNSTGHYLFESEYQKPPMNTVPWDSIDGGLAPAGVKQREGVAELHHKNGWTALAFWDRSVDKRPNSNSALFAEGTHSFDEMIQIAKDNFPQIMNRFNFPIIEIQRPD